MSSTGSPTSAGTESRLSDVIHADAYLASRLAPPLSETNCLSFTDLRDVVERFAQRVSGSLFDYGSGGAPYRSLFRGITTYIRADVTPGPAVDRLLPSNGMTEEPEASYDAVLSTQVLEHVPDPAAYLAECARLLKPGGQVLITTHGMFEEHGCPHDYHRWTARGLECAVERAGLRVEASWKLTAGARGAIQMVHYAANSLHLPERPVCHKLLAIVRRLYGWVWLPMLNAIARRFTSQGVVDASHPAAIYAGVAVIARRPKSGA